MTPSFFNLAPPDQKADYIAPTPESACVWINTQIPNKNLPVTKVIEWNGRKIAVRLSKEEVTADPEDYRAQSMFDFSKKMYNIETYYKHPLVECLTGDQETVDFSDLVARSLFGNDKIYRGAELDRTRAGKIGVDSLGVIINPY